MKKTKKISKEKESKKKKAKKEKYVPLRGLMGTAEDYHVYHMNSGERLMGISIGFCSGVIVTYTFFRSFFLALIVGAIGGILSGVPYKNYLIKKRQKQLLLQFRDLMESLTSSYSTGRNTMGAFQDAGEDLKELYGNRADIVKETGLIVTGLYNNLIIEDLLNDFAKRSGLEDVESFASVFEACQRCGGNIQNVVSDTREVIGDKIEVENEIQTILTANKNELNIMMVMPLVIMIPLSGMGDGSIVANTPVNVIVKIVVLGCFVFAYWLGRKIVNIKV